MRLLDTDNNHLRERLTFLAQELERITADLPVWG